MSAHLKASLRNILMFAITPEKTIERVENGGDMHLMGMVPVGGCEAVLQDCIKEKAEPPSEAKIGYCHMPDNHSGAADIPRSIICRCTKQREFRRQFSIEVGINVGIEKYGCKTQGGFRIINFFFPTGRQWKFSGCD